MELQEFAKAILFSDRIEDKLFSPSSLEDQSPGEEIPIPNAPGRPAPLRFLQNQHSQKFPAKSSFHIDSARGRVLHFFANHELLALELMALALLRFPKAPAGFRIGIGQTMLEEQSHMRLYLGRMEQLGVGFGDADVNDFFWNCIADMKSPLDYCARMSMTLEQANLDYASHYRDVFAEIGDLDTSKILHQVYEEEIGHVKHGVAWFGKLRPQGNVDHDDFATYANLLERPLSPRRGKGIGFDEEGRRRAGFSQAFIDAIRVYSQSKGRPPHVYYFDPNTEEHLARSKRGFTPNKQISDFWHDYQHIMSYLANDDDVVLSSEAPSSEYLKEMQSYGFSIPEYLAADRSDQSLAKAFTNRKFESFKPFGWSQELYDWFQPQTNKLISKSEWYPWAQNSPVRSISSKSWSLDLRHQYIGRHPNQELFSPEEKGVLCHSIDEVMEAIDTLNCWDSILIKGIFGASGNNSLRLKLQPKQSLDLNSQNWLQSILNHQGAVVCERWLNKVQEFGLQLQLEKGADHCYTGFSCFSTNKRGQLSEFLIGKRKHIVAPEIYEWLARHHTSLNDTFLSISKFVAAALLAQGYTGPAGVDLFFYLDETNQLRLRPIAEVNIRYTFGHIALGIERHLQKDSYGIWLHTTRRELERQLGDRPIDKLIKHRRPVVMNQNRIESGLIFTNNPRNFRTALGLLCVGSRDLIKNGGIATVLAQGLLQNPDD